MVRGFVFDTKIWNNIFEDLYCPIQVGNSSNVVSIRGNLFTLTRGPRNIKLSETWMPIIDSDNVFQGTGTTVVGGIRYHNLGGIDIELTACWGAKIGGYFEPAMGILADGCPELELNGVTCASTMLSSGTNNALLATANTNRGYHYQMPLRSTVRNVTMDKDLSGKYLVNNFTSWISSVVPVDQHPDVLTLVDAINVRFPSGFTMYGNAAYPLLEEKAWTPTVIGDTGAIGTYADRFGYYIQRGRSVIAYFRVCWTNKGNLAGAVRIGGLPFKVRDVAPDGATIQYSPPAEISECAPITFPGAYGRIAAQGNPGTTEVAILQSSTLGATVSTANASMFGAFGIIIGSITYAID